MSERSDGELLGAVRDGDRAAWEVLVRRHSPRLWAIARAQGLDRAAASDAVQTAWLALVDGVDKIREPDALPGWLATVVRHEAIRLGKRQTRETPELDATPRELADGQARSHDATVIAAEDAGALHVALAQLPDTQRELLMLLFSDAELSYADISAITGIPIGSIGPTRGRALAALRKLLEA